MKRLFAALALLGIPVAGHAQALRCALPAELPTAHADLPSAEQPQRVVPIGGYTLALSWAPQFCRDRSGDASARIQCGGGNRFGFVLHGLWPDGEGKDWPQYCTAIGFVDPATVRRALCATPSVQLIQHEWAKHGTCMARTPADYFARSNALYRALRYPDMTALSRRPLTAGQLASAIARANPGLRAGMMRITAAKGGWLDEIWLCLDRRQHYATCPAHQGGVAASSRLKIWRGRS